LVDQEDWNDFGQADPQGDDGSQNSEVGRDGLENEKMDTTDRHALSRHRRAEKFWRRTRLGMQFSNGRTFFNIN
jgi:hypothetical protein